MKNVGTLSLHERAFQIVGVDNLGMSFSQSYVQKKKNPRLAVMRKTISSYMSFVSQFQSIPNQTLDTLMYSFLK